MLTIADYLRWRDAALQAAPPLDPAVRERWLREGQTLPTGPTEPLTPLGPIERLVVHHSQSRGGNVAFYRAFHVLENGWADIGYHYVIGDGQDGHSQLGIVETGRDVGAVGAHVRGWNAGSLGICLTGDFDLNPPPPEQWMALLALLRTLMRQHRLAPEAVGGHREFPGADKTCPGRRFDLDALRMELARA